MLGKYIESKTLILRLQRSKFMGLGFVPCCRPIINICHQWFPSFRCVIERIPVACHNFSGECHWFKLDCKFIKLYLAIICWYWFRQCVQVCSKVRVLVMMKKECVWLVQVKRFHCPIGVFFISLQALTEVLFSFVVSPFGCYCSGKLCCTGFTCAFVIALTLHKGGEGGNGGYWLWALLGGSSGVHGQLLLKVGAFLFDSTHFLCRLGCLTLLWWVVSKNARTMCSLLYEEMANQGGYHGLYLLCFPWECQDTMELCFRLQQPLP